ncbi:hypothetical protein [Bacteroides coprosuis]|uniref:hypothetical protein n=1 Tax=Bacteroides coprosuis TaxID=151276 RepID=UPI001D3EF241|nr:hypothetical protein [Bacteroides coprosuis]HJD92068.1 hypothetical protein [Bacteroides coprosuis]
MKKEYLDNLKPLEEKYKIEFDYDSDPNEILFSFIDEDDFDYQSINFGRLIEYTEFEYDKIDDYTIKTRNIFQIQVSLDENLVNPEILFNIIFYAENYNVQLVDCPFLIGLYNSEHHCYNRDYDIYPAQNRYAFEIKYLTDTFENDQLSIVKRVLYYINCKFDIKLNLEPLDKPGEYGFIVF